MCFDNTVHSNFVLRGVNRSANAPSLNLFFLGASYFRTLQRCVKVAATTIVMSIASGEDPILGYAAFFPIANNRGWKDVEVTEGCEWRVGDQIIELEQHESYF